MLPVAEPIRWLQRARPLLGTVVSIRVPDADGAEAAIVAAFAEIARLQDELSAHAADSALAHLNAHAHLRAQPLHGALGRVLRASLALARASDGQFDPSVGGRLVAKGMRPRPAGIRADPRASWRDIRVHAGCVQFQRPLWLDFGGIAKGYAVDRALRVLRMRGVRIACISAGGDLRLAGTREVLSVRDPRDPGRSWPVAQLADAAAATSAGSFSRRARDGELFDPRSGRVLGRHCSATVIARRAIWADALTKVVLAAPRGSVPLLRRLGAEALLLDGRGGRHYLS